MTPQIRRILDALDRIEDESDRLVDQTVMDTAESVQCDATDNSTSDHTQSPPH